MIENKHIIILGDGGWGTTLGILLFKKGYKVTIWSPFEDYARLIDKKRENINYLKGIKIPHGIKITGDILCIKQASVIVIAVPSQYLRSVLVKAKKFYDKSIPVVSVVKGIENKSGFRMSEVIGEVWGPKDLAVLSGPTIALEVAKEIPTTVVAASKNKKLMLKVQDLFMTPFFRVYTNSDVAGVELSGSLKNIIAIACGVSDGLGFGTNTKAAILTRGLTEISRLGKAMGAKSETFSGISGLGDLVTTCISKQSRNRMVGELIGKGKKIKEIYRHMQMIAEGVPTTKSAYALSLKYNVDMPIIKEVYHLLYMNKSPHQTVKDLMMRRSKEE